MPFLAKGERTYKGRVHGPGGRRVIRSLDTRDRKVASKVEQRLLEWRDDKRWDVLEHVIAGDLSAHEAYLLDRANGLSARLAELTASAAEQHGTDLDPWVDRWVVEDSVRVRTADMVRRFIPTGTRFPVGGFTHAAVKTFLGTLTDLRASNQDKAAGGATKNRYLSALSVFARFLRGHEILSTNPLSEVQRFKEPSGRTLFYERADQQRLVAALPTVAAGLEAIMMGVGIEWQVLARLCVRDVNLDAMTIYAGGYKNYWRNRTTRIADEWIVPYVRDVLKEKLPGALVFPHIRPESSLALHHDTCASLGLVRTTLHDSRHSFAVQKLRDGWPVTLVAHNLGHQDAYMVFKRYGRFVPNMADFDHFTNTMVATDVATSARTRVK